MHECTTTVLLYSTHWTWSFCMSEPKLCTTQKWLYVLLWHLDNRTTTSRAFAVLIAIRRWRREAMQSTEEKSTAKVRQASTLKFITVLPEDCISAWTWRRVANLPGLLNCEVCKFIAVTLGGVGCSKRVLHPFPESGLQQRPEQMLYRNFKSLARQLPLATVYRALPIVLVHIRRRIAATTCLYMLVKQKTNHWFTAKKGKLLSQGGTYLKLKI